MKNFISQHPILSVFFSSCLGIIIFNVLVVVSVFLFSINVIKHFADTRNFSDTQKGKESFTTIYGKTESQNKILAIHIFGPILTESNNDPWENFYSEYSYGYDIKKTIIDAIGNSEIKGLLIIVDSPGGTVTGSKAIADAIDLYKTKTSKPVITYVAGLNASGAYMATANSTKILADRGTLIGSIGVIMGPFKKYNDVVAEGDFLGNVTTKGGIDSYYLYSGKDKDFGNPYKDMSEEAKSIMQSGLDQEYNFFVSHVEQSRKIPVETIIDSIGAHAYGVDQAITLKLVDQLATKDEAFIIAATEAGLKDTDYSIVTKEQGSVFDKLFELTNKNKVAQRALGCETCEKMYYLYGTPEKYFR